MLPPEVHAGHRNSCVGGTRAISNLAFIHAELNFSTLVPGLDFHFLLGIDHSGNYILTGVNLNAQDTGVVI